MKTSMWILVSVVVVMMGSAAWAIPLWDVDFNSDTAGSAPTTAGGNGGCSQHQADSGDSRVDGDDSGGEQPERR